MGTPPHPCPNANLSSLPDCNIIVQVQEYWGNSAESLARAEAGVICCSLLVLMILSQKAGMGQAWFTLGESLLTACCHCLFPAVPRHGLQEESRSESWDWQETGWPAVPQVGFCAFLEAGVAFAFLQLLGTSLMENSCIRTSTTSLSTLGYSLTGPRDVWDECSKAILTQPSSWLVAPLLLGPCYYSHSAKLHRQNPK